MMVYHGSNMAVATPDVLHSRETLDFGKGFYVTPLKKQAEKWALRKSFFNMESPVVSVYEMQDIPQECKVLKFPEEGDYAWLEFVCSCRRNSEAYKEYDVIIGPVANDKVFRVVDMYFRGMWSKEKTLEELRFQEKTMQICFVNQSFLTTLLEYKSSYKLGGYDG